MKDSHNFSVVKIKLPKHLADWLYEFSSQIAMQPDQVIATILTYYYEAWKAGFEKGQKTSLQQEIAEKEFANKFSEANLEDLMIRFIREKNIKRNVFLIKRFVRWINESNFTISEINRYIIEKFLENYLKDHNISKASYNNYKGLLRKFVNYVQQISM